MNKIYSISNLKLKYDLEFNNFSSDFDNNWRSKAHDLQIRRWNRLNQTTKKLPNKHIFQQRNDIF